MPRATPRWNPARPGDICRQYVSGDFLPANVASDLIKLLAKENISVSDATLETLFYVLQYGTFAIAIYLTVMVFVRSKRYRKTILMGCFWMFLWAIANCMVFPGLFTLLGYKSAFGFSPEMPGVVAVAFMGWLFGIYIAVTIFIITLAIRAFNVISKRINKNA